ncbi:2OG-Fe(II) oxygenase [Streptomyces sp. NPDC101733]|uniref:2OG-Fe(II) oxygenase n=1 Tax=unclassified Streptomyces TaxID=2593676 RepID=UPI00382C5E2E
MERELVLFEQVDGGAGEAPPDGGVVDWGAVYRELDERGVALTPPLLSPEQCARVAATFDRPGMFRSTVVMERHQYGRGVYRYFADPAAVPEVGGLREGLYPGLAWIANRWAGLLGEPAFPPTLEGLREECARRGQVRPTPLLLRYGPGGWAALHQDVYGDLVFPLQVAVMLNQPGADFTGGESVFVEQRPRAQSRAVVVRPALGQGVVFPVRERPVRGAHGVRRHAMRHGTNEVGSGRRNVLGVIFHDAR